MKRFLSLFSIALSFTVLAPTAEVQAQTTESFAYRHSNPNSPLLMAPSSLGQRARTGYFNTFLGLVNRAELGFTDWISVSAGITTLLPSVPFYFSVKTTHEVLPNFRVGGLLTYNAQFGPHSFITATKHTGYGLAPGLVAGYGNEDYNISASTSYFVAGNGSVRTRLKFFDFSTDPENVIDTYRYGNAWTLNVVGQARATNSVAVIAEYNQILDRYVVLGGVRILKPSGQSAWDLGIAGSSWSTFPLPYVGYTFNF